MILFRRPSTLPYQFTAALTDLQAESDGHSGVSASSLVQSLCTPDIPTDDRAMQRWDVVSLISISLLHSHSCCTDSGPSCTQGIVESALYRWYKAQSNGASERSLLMYHLVGMHSYSDLHLLQHHSRLATGNGAQSQIQRKVRDWRSTSRCSLAAWHARNVLEMSARWPQKHLRLSGDHSICEHRTSPSAYTSPQLSSSPKRRLALTETPGGP